MFAHIIFQKWVSMRIDFAKYESKIYILGLILAIVIVLLK